MLPCAFPLACRIIHDSEQSATTVITLEGKHACLWPTSTGKQATCKPLEGATVLQIATQLGKTPAQVLIRWGIQRGTVVIPKSINPERIANNFDVLSWELPEDAMAQLSSFRCTT